ncbi:hypothetical protein FISHEDRAFT_55521 [Fistulina hepatica ATCC 64428]|uniref:Intradiol ring-cleavage dioxygenases domain-containing protein n=1 Tax=Fistulina hepatica ATCC 64428 TaxID=1128425 RepID=A0A0D7ANG7_9AGAR|nr:hypothetical protein FISHEDRAFT_55521 [Fistulina hepatica ATCC 64428]
MAAEVDMLRSNFESVSSCSHVRLQLMAVRHGRHGLRLVSCDRAWPPSSQPTQLATLLPFSRSDLVALLGTPSPNSRLAMIFLRILLLAPFIISVLGHAGSAPENWKRDRLERCISIEKRCGDVLAMRKAKRETKIFARYGLDKFGDGFLNYSGEIIRQNITEDQLGIPFEVSVDFIDVITCESIQAWIDMWHANATVISFGGSGGSSSVSAFPSGVTPSASFAAPTGFGSGASLGGDTMTATTPYSGADEQSDKALLDTTMTANSTSLRGVWKTDEDGHLSVYSVLPGWYSGRVQHFDIKVYPDGYNAENDGLVGSITVMVAEFDVMEFLEEGLLPYASTSLLASETTKEA